MARAYGSAKSPSKTGVSSSSDVTTLRCTPLAMDGLFPRGPSVGARPAGTKGWPARAFGSIDVFRGPVGDPVWADVDAQAAKSTATKTTEEAVRARELRTRLIPARISPIYGNPSAPYAHSSMKVATVGD